MEAIQQYIIPSGSQTQRGKGSRTVGAAHQIVFLQKNQRIAAVVQGRTPVSSGGSGIFDQAVLVVKKQDSSRSGAGEADLDPAFFSERKDGFAVAVVVQGDGLRVKAVIQRNGEFVSGRYVRGEVQVFSLQAALHGRTVLCDGEGMSAVVGQLCLCRCAASGDRGTLLQSELYPALRQWFQYNTTQVKAFSSMYGGDGGTGLAKVAFRRNGISSRYIVNGGGKNTVVTC